MRLSAALTVTLLVLLAAGTGTAAPSAAPDIDAPDGPAQTRAPPEQKGTIVTIQLRENGDARWNVTSRFPLGSENETAAFERTASDFESGDLDTQFSADLFERIADRAAERTGRPMEITAVSRTSNVTNESGRLTLSFTWTNFARTDDAQLVLGDVFDLRSGSWLPALTDDQRLIVHPPEGYVVSTSPRGVGVSHGTIDIAGPHAFGEEGLEIQYVRSEGSTTPFDPKLPLDWQQLPVAVVLLMAMGVGGLGVYVWSKRHGGPVESGATDRVETGDPPATDHRPTEPAEESSSEDSDEVPAELLSDEERVERLIERNGGRMMQANIVKETNWSNAKVSQLLSSMDEAGRIDKLRIGRENLITFPDEDVTDIE